MGRDAEGSVAKCSQPGVGGERGGADQCQRIIVSGRAGEGRLGTEGQGGICM